MHFNLHPIAAGAFFISSAIAQTPPNSQPETADNLGVTYGNVQISPGLMLPRPSTTTIPTFAYTPTSNSTYTLLMVDLSINTATTNTSALNPNYQLPLAAGISANRTTRLHFWQAGLTFTSNGTLVNATEPVAFYQGPNPPPGDIPHVYAFYLFQQEEGFAPPPEDSPFAAANVNARPTNRASFDIQGFAEEDGVGQLVAANYIMVQNTTGSSSRPSGGAGSPTGSTTGSVTAPSAPAFTGLASSVGLGAVGGLSMAVGIALAVLLA